MSSYKGPTFFHQLGHQDQQRSLALLKDGYGGGAILSPKHLKDLPKYANLFSEIQTELLIDPQFYSPRTALDNPQDEDLQINQTSDLANLSVSRPIIERRLEYQQSLGASRLLIPCPVISSFTNKSSDIIHSFALIAREWRQQQNLSLPLMSTIAVSRDIISSSETRFALLNSIVGIDVEGFYLAIEMPDLLDDENLIIGILDTVFRLKQNQFELVLGYSGFWTLLTFPLGLDIFASSAWENRRTFKVTDWHPRKKAFGKRKTYYWSNDLMDKIIFPDEADLLRDKGMWEILLNDSPFTNMFDRSLAPSIIHTSKQWKEGDSLKHYFWALHRMSNDFAKLNRQSRIDAVRNQLESTIELYERIKHADIPLRANGNKFIVWLQSFDNYISKIYKEIVREYD